MIIFNNVSKTYKLAKFKVDSFKNIFSFSKGKYGEAKVFHSLKNVSFSINEGDCVGILGRNGAGKSTILKLISKITLPTEGTIELGGRVSSLLEVGAGFHPELSGHDNIYLSGAILGMTPKEVSNKVAGIIEFSGIGDFIYQPVKTYSMGMYLRLAFSIGISLESEILVIDEALSVGDYDFQQKCLNRLNELISEGKTIVFVSHDINQVKGICNKALILKNGELVYSGAVADAEEVYLSL